MDRKDARDAAGRSEVTRGKIIDAALELVNDGGCSSTGLGDIVERAG